MKRRQASKGAADDRDPYPPGKVTVANYNDLAVEFVRRGGGEMGDDAIRNFAAAARDGKPETPERWVAWLAFFDQLGLAKAAAFARETGMYAVPARWPWDFSADAAPIEGRLHGLLRDYDRMRDRGTAKLLLDDLDAAPRTMDVGALKDLHAARQTAEAEDREKRAKELGEFRRAHDEELRCRSFIEAGVEPPKLAPGQIGMSYGMMLNLGWTVGPGPNGTNVMVRLGRRSEPER